MLSLLLEWFLETANNLKCNLSHGASHRLLHEEYDNFDECYVKNYKCLACGRRFEDREYSHKI